MSDGTKQQNKTQRARYLEPKARAVKAANSMTEAKSKAFKADVETAYIREGVKAHEKCTSRTKPSLRTHVRSLRPGVAEAQYDRMEAEGFEVLPLDAGRAPDLEPSAHRITAPTKKK